MKILILAGLMITLPAIAVIIVYFGQPIMYGAMASLFINLLPFAIAILLTRGRDSSEVGH